MKTFGVAVKQDGTTLVSWDGLTTPDPNNVDDAVREYPRMGSTSEVIAAAVRNQIVNVQGHIRPWAEAVKESTGKWPTLAAVQKRCDEYRTTVRPRGKVAQQKADVDAIMADVDVSAEDKLLAVLKLIS